MIFFLPAFHIGGYDANIPQFDLQKWERTSYREFSAESVSLLLIEGTHALHNAVAKYADLSVAVVGGIHYSLINRIGRDAEKHPQVYLSYIFFSPPHYPT